MDSQQQQQTASSLKFLGRCFSCKEKKEFTSQEQKSTPKNKTTEIHIGPCITCGKRVSTIVKRKVEQSNSEDANVNISSSKKVVHKNKKQKKAAVEK